jgi:hypothetical protein
MELRKMLLVTLPSGRWITQFATLIPIYDHD